MPFTEVAAAAAKLAKASAETVKKVAEVSAKAAEKIKEVPKAEKKISKAYKTEDKIANTLREVTNISNQDMEHSVDEALDKATSAIQKNLISERKDSQPKPEKTKAEDIKENIGGNEKSRARAEKIAGTLEKTKDISSISNQDKEHSVGEILDKTTSAIQKEIGQEKNNDTPKSSNEIKESNREKNEVIGKNDDCKEKLEKTLKTPEGIKNLMEQHPEKAELWEKLNKNMKVLNDHNASTFEKKSANCFIEQHIKGEMLELSVKDTLKDAGMAVEDKQHKVEGLNGNTKPDIVAKNTTDHPVSVFGHEIKAGEYFSAECKCGSENYISNQLSGHIQNQLSGLSGNKFLITTSEGKNVSAIDEVCKEFGASPIVLDVSSAEISSNIKEACN